MNDSGDVDRILAALRKMTLWIQLWVLWTIFIGIIAVFANNYQITALRKAIREIGGSERPLTWRSVYDDVDAGRSEQAIEKAKILVAREPNQPSAHTRLASLYLANDDLSSAEMEYKTAYDLWPSEENEKALATIEKRIETTKVRQQ